MNVPGYWNLITLSDIIKGGLDEKRPSYELLKMLQIQ